MAAKKKKTGKRIIKKVRARKATKIEKIKKTNKIEKTNKKLVKKENVKALQPPADMKKIATILAGSQVRQRLIELGGENALAIIRNFEQNYSDEEISKNLELKISDVRATLNKLHNEGLVNYLREKDNETGWYSYSWSLNVERVEKWAKNSILSVADYENGQQYYFCGSCGSSSVVNFESAYDLNFKCERCEKSLDHIDERKLQDLYEKRNE